MMNWLNQSEKLEVLEHTYKYQIQEVMFRRDREFKIFTWSSALFVALIGALLIVRNTETIVWQHLGLVGKIIVSITVGLMTIYSISWQNRERRLCCRNAIVITKISKLLHCFDRGYYGLEEETSLFPSEWEQ